MKSKSCCSRSASVPAGRKGQAQFLLCAVLALGLLAGAPATAAGDAPPWMHALAGRSAPAEDDKADAVLLYGDISVNVVSAEKIRTVVRRAYKILRPAGREYGIVHVILNSDRKIVSLHGWCIPAQGKDYEVKDKEAVEVSLPNIAGSELFSDVKVRVLRLPAADPGNIVGYEYEVEERPMLLQDTWHVQEAVPVREARFYLQLPADWEFKASWLNAPEIQPTQTGRQWQWTVTDQKAIRKEDDMPPVRGLTAQMVISYLAPGSPSSNGFTNWRQMGAWYRNLTAGRMDASLDIKQKVSELTASSGATLDKMKALARFIQHDIRYVAIELGIGGWQPHAAEEVFTHRYGDCKDKATLFASMLHAIGVDSYYVVINTDRGSVGPRTPAHNGFNHVILAIKLPPYTSDKSLVATVEHPDLGKVLFFDPTNELTPFGEIAGHLQANYGLLVTADGGELLQLPVQPPAMNGIRRAGKMRLDSGGTLRGDVEEARVGDLARSQRWAQRNATTETARMKPIERLFASSMSYFKVTHATLASDTPNDQPVELTYAFEAEKYAKTAGGLLLLRPRVLGSRASAILETKEPRQFPIEFDGPERDTDNFEITLPAGYEVEELPVPVDVDLEFASYHSKTESNGTAIRYSRTFEVKQLSVPASQAAELKRFYRIIATDERSTAVLRPK
jgi:uncharacterized protein DUF3857/transglutaminase superfamily protein